jgi:hypothetical protein
MSLADILQALPIDVCNYMQGAFNVIRRRMCDPGVKEHFHIAIAN